MPSPLHSEAETGCERTVLVRDLGGLRPGAGIADLPHSREVGDSCACAFVYLIIAGTAFVYLIIAGTALVVDRALPAISASEWSGADNADH